MSGKQLTKHFWEDEFRCRCQECRSGDGIVLVDEDFVKRLEKVRVKCDFPFEIRSGYRCPKKNASAGGKSKSAHLLGKGADIFCNHSFQRWGIVRWAIKYGFTRIGIGKNFVHLDIDDSLPTPRIWTYYPSD